MTQRAPARLRHRRAVQAEQAKTLNDDGVAERDLGGFGDGGHGGNPAIERRRLLVAELVGKLQDPGAGQDVAVLGKSAEKVRILLREIVAILAHAVALLRHVEDFTVIALSVEEIFTPGDAVAELERIAAHIQFDVFTDFLDGPDDLMAENSRTRIWPPPFIGMDIRAADRRHRHLDQDFTAMNRPQGKILHDEGCVRCFVDGGLGGAHC